MSSKQNEHKTGSTSPRKTERKEEPNPTTRKHIDIFAVNNPKSRNTPAEEREKFEAKVRAKNQEEGTLLMEVMRQAAERKERQKHKAKQDGGLLLRKKGTRKPE